MLKFGGSSVGVYLRACRHLSAPSGPALRSHRLPCVLHSDTRHLQAAAPEGRFRPVLRPLSGIDILIPLLHRVHQRDSSGLRGRPAYQHGTDSQHPVHPHRRLFHRQRHEERGGVKTGNLTLFQDYNKQKRGGHHLPFTIFFISLSLFRASTGVRLLMSSPRISSRIWQSTGSSSLKKESCIPSRLSSMA